MLTAIIRFSIHNKLIVGLLILGLVTWGAYALTQLPIDAVPDITNNQVQVLTIAPSQSAVDIERLVTFPVEQAVATIPGVLEIRSISRFGQSIVTIVFSDSDDLYWARQQVNERLSEARKQIPEGVGDPEVGPITTGLGEIYQYRLKVSPAYESRYSIMELRTIQDWIIRRQLLGTEGVADVSSFGGYVKQYEIAIDPEKIRALDLSISEIFDALGSNNQNTGGAYIEKNKSAYFIRSEGLLQSMNDISDIVVRDPESGPPLLMRDVATLHEGHAIRYGAMTVDGKGETVGAVVLMLKGANSSQVIANVKERIGEIEKTLPEGVTVEPFLDRTRLVNHAIHTVLENLAVGALIVIFVLVLLLGDLRAGLIVASVIPLSMLFAVIMMNLFNVSGNLMSLGAIDFGLIVDGAVIVVEATLFHIHSMGITTRLSQDQMDREVEMSAGKMMNAAAFGQIIILMVYLPILSLVGIEGKMFRPMAETVIFAILGAFILSLTYVPMASALFLKNEAASKKNISRRILDKAHRIYEPILIWSLEHKGIILGSSLAALVVSIVIFNRLGGEFLPELDEGDLAVETRVLTGSSLSTTVDVTLKTEQVLLKHFPEVEKVVAKIGTSEIPVDPMPIELADVIVVMKDKSEWVSANTKNELIDKMRDVLQQNLPGVSFGFQHPIQMRFNELMTGARQDVVIKVYGEDLDELVRYAQHIARLSTSIEGTEDLYIEPVTGMQQIVIRIRRDRLARFGVSVEEINDVINTAMAGQSAGMVFEGEKRFDVVVRMDIEKRQSVEDVSNLYVTNSHGEQLPLAQLADITMEAGPSQIQRDDTRRRIVVGFNIRGRDVETIVRELRELVEKNIKLSPGYSIKYGGTFENLVQAKQRLSVAVPLSLLLIFVLLYFTFHSVVQGLLIYTAIPLSAIGGVFALLIRSMPFSISAGIGFIALFGVAVLNGIVLISEFNKLKKEGLEDVTEIIMRGTSTRLRPVLMTAMVASLGFLPMALSHGSGAEVQKPLATVVIGGLVSATLLTLIVLPVLYMVVERKRSGGGSINKLASLAIIMFAMGGSAIAQSNKVSFPEAAQMAMEKSPALQAATLDTDRQKTLKNTIVDIPKTDVTLLYGQYNSIVKRDNNISIKQTIPFPTVFVRNHALSRELIRSSELSESVTRNEIMLKVKMLFNELLYLKAWQQMLLRHDSVLSDLSRVASLHYKTGEGTLLAKTLTETQYAEMKNQITRNEADIRIGLDNLQLLCQAPLITDIDGALETFIGLRVSDTTELLQNPILAVAQQQVKVSQQQQKLEGARAMPDLHIGYFNQTLIGPQNVDGQETYYGSDKRFQGFQAGISFPIWFVPYTARAKAAKLSALSSQRHFESNRIMIQQQYNEAIQEVEKNRNSLAYYQTTALETADLLVNQSRKSYQSGELDFSSLLFSLRQALNIREGYVSAWHEYNRSIILVEYLSGSLLLEQN